MTLYPLLCAKMPRFYINEDVLERASYPYIVRKPIEDESAELELEEFRSFLEDLDPKDFS